MRNYRRVRAKTGGLIPSDDYWFFATGFDARTEESVGTHSFQKLGYKFRRRVLNGDFD